MAVNPDTWTQEHDLALVYLSLAYGTDQELSDNELATITDVLGPWRDEFPPDEVLEVVMEAVTVYLEEGNRNEVLRAIDTLKQHLSEDERRRALEDVVRIAEADGVLLSSERSLITRLAEKWSIKAAGEELLKQTTASTDHQPSWTLLHDVSLMYVIMAHSTDNELSDDEITVMIERLRDWQPELDEPRARSVLREVLAYYSRGPEQDSLRDSVEVIREMLPAVQRLALIDDLLHIAQADGELMDTEQTLLRNLAKAWGVGVRMENSGA